MLVIAVLIARSGAAVFTAAQIGISEPYEVIKGLLWAKGFTLYGQMWNDQPPLHTVLLGLCFKVFGPGIPVARALAVMFGLFLLAGCGLLVKCRCGLLAAVLATICLLAAPGVFELCVSVMLEVPAIATALWALLPILQWREKGHWSWLALSGALLAVALQIKLTAAVVAPALAVEVLLATTPTRSGWPNQIARALAIWVASLAAVYSGLAVLLGSVPLDVLWASHFSVEMLAHAGESANLPFWPILWFHHKEALCTASTGLVVMVWRWDWRRLAFPFVWLLTAAFVHVQHRPWWPYYYLHLAVPLAWLSAYGTAELFHVAWVMAADRSRLARLLSYAWLGAASVLLLLITGYGGRRLWAEMDQIRHLPRVGECAVVAKMKEYSARTNWVYARQTIYPFHAGLLVIPELAVLPSKRFWSGQITEEQVWATVKRYGPQQLLLGPGELKPDWLQFIQARYALVYEGEGQALYVAKALANTQIENRSAEPSR